MSDEVKKTIRLKSVGTPAAGNATPEIPGVKQTIKLRPSGMMPPPMASTSVSPDVKRTIKLTPPPMPSAPQTGVPTASGRLPPVMGAVPTSTGRVPTSSGHIPTSTGKVPIVRPVTAPQGTTVPTSTGKVPTFNPPPPIPGEPGLSTSSGRIAHVAVPPSQLLDTATASVPKIVPLSTSTASGLSTPDVPAAPSHGARTLQLKRPNQPDSSNATVNLSAPPASSAPTINLTPGDGAETHTVKKTLSLKKAGTVSEHHEELAKNIADNGEDSDSGVGYRPNLYRSRAEEDDSTGGLGFTIVASIAFCCLAFLAYAAYAQYGNLWSDDAAKTPESAYASVPSFPSYSDAANGKIDF